MTTMTGTTTKQTDEELVRAAHAGDDRAVELLTRRYQPLVIATAARLHRRRGTEHDDVVSCGQVGLQKAINHFDASRGVPFAAYAKAKVRGEMMRWFRDDRYVVHVPRTLHEVAMRVRSTQRELETTLTRSPTVDEIADQLDVEPETVIEALAVSSAERLRMAELGAWVQEGSDGHRSADLAIAFEALDRRSRRILHHRHVELMSQREIGAILGVSQAHVSRLESAALDQLRQEMLRLGVTASGPAASRSPQHSAGGPPGRTG